MLNTLNTFYLVLDTNGVSGAVNIFSPVMGLNSCFAHVSWFSDEKC